MAGNGWEIDAVAARKVFVELRRMDRRGFVNPSFRRVSGVLMGLGLYSTSAQFYYQRG
uniref:Uncharacterized protein n=1 Tax=Oryza sativa subsp. japonica TaxID=39947 RepID=Q6K2A3_ORYSJ|nr:hypothetical protein [Oryza sativa Japonica Group]